MSDLPIENLILLKSNSAGKCQIESKFDKISESFASNIHNLLSDSFFMNQGLIGEFATEKINFYFDRKNHDTEINVVELKRLLNIIGEPLIKLKLQEIYADILNQSRTETELINEIANLTNRLNKLKSNDRNNKEKQ